ncbi:PfkB family carbohydrate kinase [Synoicihabitans lomoniglobus]|uniref:PfkB family carbohydrate kinase n=1 Tax=Synoicihabitans lomoniglobus TaxID=2909285 RepID=A0AAF0I4I4_9BACT|nr:PfkB family carbohydrate kinase [Opitutaceae bacterium LMO-M01]WED66809.1 PfkB family carbohydrate kinase [Opitutaceae bacterium LMO-M01]
MDFRQATLDELRQNSAGLEGKLAVVGLDGFVDTIVTPVALRSGQGDDFEAIPTIKDFGERIVGAAGKSTNLELYPRMDKLGGNGPIMATALLQHGFALKYIGSLGRFAIHPVFQEMASRSEIVSLSDPATTIAVEFDDGKLMLGQMRSLDEVTFERMVEKMGMPALEQAFGAADLVALVNWTMIPGMSEIFRELVETVLPKLPARDRVFFFDLADPEKRSEADLLAALELIGRFGAFGQVTLGLNLKEAQRVHRTIGFHALPEDEAGLRQIAADIREKLNYATVVVHPKESAACATAEGTYWIPGPYVKKPLITTGAGDHFNAGFSTGQLLGLSPQACLTTGVCTSGHYVRTAQSPTLADLESFLANWS